MQVACGGLLIMVASYLYPYVEGSLSRYTPGCLFHRLTGLPCLLCGMTRSFAATAHGRLWDALRMHLMGPPLFALLFALTAGMLAEKACGRRIFPRPGERAWKRIGWSALAMLVICWFARLAFFGVNV